MGNLSEARHREEGMVVSGGRLQTGSWILFRKKEEDC